MRPVRSLLLYLLAILLAGALVSPWLYWLVQDLAQHFPSWQRLAHYPFNRFVSRAMLLAALIGLWPFLRSLGLRSWTGVGLVRWEGQGRRLAWGFLLGFGSLACAAALALGCGARALQGDVTAALLGKRLLSAALTAGVVGVLEELLFRGAMFGALRKAHSWITALWLSSAVYALVHFFQRSPSPPEITWATGFFTLAQMLRGFADGQALVPGFLALTLAGAMLALGYQRTGNLYFSIGLHAGWIFWLKFYGALTTEVTGVTWFWGTSRLIDGWLALAVLLAALAVLWTTLKETGHERDRERPA